VSKARTKKPVAADAFMRSGLVILAGIIVLIGAACGTPERAPVTTGQYRTFSVGSLPLGSPSLDPAAAERLNHTLRAAIVEALTDKGYLEASQADGDLIVKVHTEYYQDFSMTSSEQRALAIALLDSRKNQEIWRTNRGRSSPYALEPDVLRKGVLEMLASVPEASSR
jgi:hypothetical protein